MLTRTKIALAAAALVGLTSTAGAQSFSFGVGPDPYYGNVGPDPYYGNYGYGYPGYGWGPGYGAGGPGYGAGVVVTPGYRYRPVRRYSHPYYGRDDTTGYAPRQRRGRYADQPGNQ